MARIMEAANAGLHDLIVLNLVVDLIIYEFLQCENLSNLTNFLL